MDTALFIFKQTRFARTDLRVSDESDADGKLSPHSPREGLGPGVPLVFQVKNADDALNLVWDLLARETL